MLISSYWLCWSSHLSNLFNCLTNHTFPVCPEGLKALIFTASVLSVIPCPCLTTVFINWLKQYNIYQFCTSWNWVYLWSAMCIQGSPSEIQTPKHWNCNSHSITALSPTLLPSSILLPPLSHNAVFLARKNLAQIKKMYYFSSLKLHKWRSVCNGDRSVSVQMWSCWTNTTSGKKKLIILLHKHTWTA
jgi:hypothetical protein